MYHLGNYVQIIRNIEGHPVAEVGQSNRKDVRNAVEVAIKAQPGWEKRSGFNKAQILRYIGKYHYKKFDFFAEIL